MGEGAKRVLVVIERRLDRCRPAAPSPYPSPLGGEGNEGLANGVSLAEVGEGGGSEP